MFRSCEWEVLERSLNILQASDFYWGPLSVGEAHAKLQREPVGTYLVRDSSQGNCLFSLSVRMPTGPVSLRISFQEGYFRLKNWFSDCVVQLLELVVAGTRNNPLHFDEMGGTPLVFSEPLCRSRRTVPTLRELCYRSLPAGEGVDVQQKPPIQVALLKEEISIPCKVIFPYMPKYTEFSIFYYWINSLGQKTSIYNRSEKIHIPSGAENETATLSYDHRIVLLEKTSSTGTYYCKVKWNDMEKVGKGVFVLARVCAYSVVALVNLAVQLSKTSVRGPYLPVRQSLDVQQIDVYSVLENNTDNSSLKKNPPRKTPKKQATLEESSDTLYENI
ncbi:hypothetical protein BTVI_09371 [Pitangus sulphuratus]|nr:hypothetical protein BTVI_09371 [Pitangus sulphuratus]